MRTRPLTTVRFRMRVVIGRQNSSKNDTRSMVGGTLSAKFTSGSVSAFISRPGAPTFRCTWLKRLVVPITSPVWNRVPRRTRTRVGVPAASVTSGNAAGLTASPRRSRPTRMWM
jgi:hypothetical protein